MNKRELRRLPPETLASLLEVCLDNFRICDGLWYLGVEERYGTEAATAIDLQVWERLIKVEAEALKKTLNIGEGIEGLVEAIGLSPSWSIVGDLEVNQTSATEGVVRVINCRPQEARLRQGKEPFPCRHLERTCFTVFAQTLDPRIRVSCAFSPPERRSPPWCEWHFHLGSRGAP